jgi:hypothetical protein
MFKPKQPALRHFAVLECVKSGRFGSLWSVHDRRGSTKAQYLLVASRVKPWPVLLTLLEDMQPNPVRLRNGRVGLLLSGIELGHVTDALKQRSRNPVLALDALNGFVQSKKAKRVVNPLLLGIGFVVALAVVLVPQQYSRQPAVSVPREVKSSIGSCTNGPQQNQKIEGQSRRFSEVRVGQETYTIANVSKLGGLAQLKLKRGCDSKYFRVDAWIRASELTVSKVY